MLFLGYLIFSIRWEKPTQNSPDQVKKCSLHLLILVDKQRLNVHPSNSCFTNLSVSMTYFVVTKSKLLICRGANKELNFYALFIHSDTIFFFIFKEIEYNRKEFYCLL